MSNAVQWLALSTSILSVGVAGAAWWLSREKLRLDLYNRRFDVYNRTLDFYHALPDEAEFHAPDVAVPEIERHRFMEGFKEKQRNFIKASREARFLFDDAS